MLIMPCLRADRLPLAIPPFIVNPMDLILISGLSGSGKSVALHLLEDTGYYCVENLPAVMLPSLVRMLREQGQSKVAVALDARAALDKRFLEEELQTLRQEGIPTKFLFLQASEETLIKRYSETRRRHPLATSGQSLGEAIRIEMELLEPLTALGHRIDTSHLKPNALREWIRQFITQTPAEGLTLMFQSFGFKHGLPTDADLVFDVRCLPNPHYDPFLRPLTGKDAPVVVFLEQQPEVLRMREDIRRFVADWLPAYIRDNRNYLTVAIGCTGGQHRSVFIAEWLARQFAGQADVLVRHRTLAGQG